MKHPGCDGSFQIERFSAQGTVSSNFQRGNLPCTTRMQRVAASQHHNVMLVSQDLHLPCSSQCLAFFGKLHQANCTAVSFRQINHIRIGVAQSHDSDMVPRDRDSSDGGSLWNGMVNEIDFTEQLDAFESPKCQIRN
jgi:hypothetical protein